MRYAEEVIFTWTGGNSASVWAYIQHQGTDAFTDVGEIQTITIVSETWLVTCRFDAVPAGLLEVLGNTQQIALNNPNRARARVKGAEYSITSFVESDARRREIQFTVTRSY